MTGRLTPTDAERQTALSAENYLNRALRMLAERLGWEKLLEKDPAGFAVQFAPLLSALIEAQASEYQSWVLYERLREVADASRDALGDLANVLSGRLESLNDYVFSGFSDIAAHLEEGNIGTCRACVLKARNAHREAQREAREAAENGE